MNRPWFLGAAVALATIALGVGLVLLAASGGAGDTGAATGPNAGGGRTSTTTSAKDSKKTTTTTGTATTSSSSATSAPSASPATPTTTAADAPDPPNPADAYKPVPLPRGISASITSCGWSPANGGELQAGGTVTNSANDVDAWLITAVWLQRNVNQDEEIDDQTDLIDLAIGQTVPWHLTISAPSAPPNVSCAFEAE